MFLRRESKFVTREEQQEKLVFPHILIFQMGRKKILDRMVSES